jgi:hypothetical protein
MGGWACTNEECDDYQTVKNFDLDDDEDHAPTTKTDEES